MPLPSRRMALEVGYRHLDCARYYKNEEVVGQGIREWQAADPQNNRREHLFVTSKVRTGAISTWDCALSTWD